MFSSIAGRSVAHQPAGEPVPLPIEGQLPSLEGGTGWLNSEPLSPEALGGKVVLVDFWTYTCINWIRTLPYLRAWDAKYRDGGLTSIGVHTPEFGFERDIDNVTAAVRDMDIDYPIVLDSGYAIWRAFQNHYWPALYIADGHGRIRYHHFGEGEYAMAEMMLQQLLVEAGADSVYPALVSVEASGLELAADWSNLRSPETYLGSSRITGSASPDRLRFGEPHDYMAPTKLDLNQWAPSGKWTLAPHAALSNQSGARIMYRFHARDLHLIMGRASPEAPIPFRVLLDGEPPGTAHGDDLDASGNGSLTDQRLHQLIRQPGTITDRVFEIEFFDSGAEVYCFTFG
jgi:thiol-disulfide isomerase/thioredoxin